MPEGVDLGQTFPELVHDPIVESMIIFSSRAKTTWEPQTTGKKIQSSLPDYPTSHNVNLAHFSISMEPAPQVTQAGAPAPTATAGSVGWMGLRLVSKDEKRIVTITRDNLTLSRLAPYEGWTTLCSEMIRLWRIHKDIAGVDSLDNIQIRYINRLEVPAHDFDPIQYFTGFGDAPEGMARGPFLHQDTLQHAALPLHLLNLTRTVEFPATQAATIPMIVVLEAICAEPIPAEDAIIKQRLAELHWLKNYAFFNCVTERFLELCR